jgi:hypothetical protein
MLEEGAASDGEAGPAPPLSSSHTIAGVLLCCPLCCLSARGRGWSELNRPSAFTQCAAIRSPTAAPWHSPHLHSGRQAFPSPYQTWCETSGPQTVLFTVENGRTKLERAVHTQHKAPLATNTMS